MFATISFISNNICINCLTEMRFTDKQKDAVCVIHFWNSSTTVFFLPAHYNLWWGDCTILVNCIHYPLSRWYIHPHKKCFLKREIHILFFFFLLMQENMGNPEHSTASAAFAQPQKISSIKSFLFSLLFALS